MTLLRLAGGTFATAGTMLALDAAWLMSMTLPFFPNMQLNRNYFGIK